MSDTSEKKPRAKMGRPPVQIDWALVDKLCHIHCTKSEIAAVTGVSEDSLERHIKKKFGQTFAAFWEQRAAVGKMSIRRTMFDMAVNKKDRVMLIWLSKNLMGFAERIEQKSDVRADVKTEVEFVAEWGALPGAGNEEAG